MNLTTKYTGQFISKRYGVWYRVDILTPDNTATPEELTFEAEEPLLIEWSDDPKHEPMQGSTATLRIESPGDRTYVDLYTIKPGNVRMDVYRSPDGGATWDIYWSGALDPEFYEEPYERLNMYTVSLTFTDFGILDRIDFAGEKLKTLHEIITDALVASGIRYNNIDTSLISTERRNGYGADDWQKITLDEIKADCNNFFDEEGEPVKYKAVLEGILQPLGLRMMQKWGKVWIYDLNGLHGRLGSLGIEWSGATSTLSADNVYQKAILNYSPYAYSGNLLGEKCYGGLSDGRTWYGDDRDNPDGLHDVFGEASLTYNPANGYGYGLSMKTITGATAEDMVKYITIPACNEDNYIGQGAAPGFTIWLSPRCESATLSHGQAFKIHDGYSNAESEGIALFFRSCGKFYANGGATQPAHVELGLGPENPQWLFRKTDEDTPVTIFKTNPVFIPKRGKLEIDMEILLDYRPNPFESIAKDDKAKKQRADGYDHAMWEEKWKKYGQVMTIPIIVHISYNGTEHQYPSSLIYSGGGSMTKESDDGSSPCGGGWKSASRAGTSGWAPSNAKGTIFMPTMPDDGAMVSIEVLNRWDVQYEKWKGKTCQGIKNGYDQLMQGTGDWDKRGTTKYNNRNGAKLNWVLVKLPTLRYVGEYDKDLPSEDIEYSTEVNADAKEELSISTICGSEDSAIPTRGALHFSWGISGLRRGAATGKMEDLLVSTIYSQHAERHTKLSGEAYIPLSSVLTKYSEANQPGRFFMISGEVQNLIEGTTEANFVELSADEYKRKAEQNNE